MIECALILQENQNGFVKAVSLNVEAKLHPCLHNNAGKRRRSPWNHVHSHRASRICTKQDVTLPLKKMQLIMLLLHISTKDSYMSCACDVNGQSTPTSFADAKARFKSLACIDEVPCLDYPRD